MGKIQVMSRDLANRLLQDRDFFRNSGGGITLSGGEPFAQPEDCLELAKIAHTNGLNVWSYSGWTFEYLRDHGTDAQKALLAELDVLVDGPFLLAERSLALAWRGSRNQRVIDVPASLSSGQVVIRPD